MQCQNKNCSNQFQPTDSRNIYCKSIECRRDRHRQRNAKKAKNTGYKPIKCAECGKEFIPRSGKTRYCYDEDCKVNQRRSKYLRDKEMWGKRIKDEVWDPTPTTAMSIVSDLGRGWSISKIAQAYGQKTAVIEGYLQKIEQDGTADKIRKWLRSYQKNCGGAM